MAIDWEQSMAQTFEFYIVDPATWGNKTLFRDVTNCTINREWNSETKGNATIQATSILEEVYIRVYLVATQNRATEKFPLSTFLIQTPSTNYDGKIPDISISGYSPLLELKNTRPPFGYSVRQGTNTMRRVYELTQENTRAPVVETQSDTLILGDFVSDFQNDTFLTFITDLSASANHGIDLDEMGRVIFPPEQKLASLRPVWTFTDGENSIMHPNFSIDRDLYGVPNVVEVLYSTGTNYKFARVENRDPNSPVSIPRRGREVVHRVANPNSLINPTQQQVDVYAQNLLETLSILEYTLTYTHGYCPVRTGDCVMLNYAAAGLSNVKAMVMSQSIECVPGTPVTETASYTTKLWG